MLRTNNLLILFNLILILFFFSKQTLGKVADKPYIPLKSLQFTNCKSGKIIKCQVYSNKKNRLTWTLKSDNIGLSEDQVAFLESENGQKKKALLKIFSKKANQKNEIANSQTLSSIGLKEHMPKIYSEGTFIDKTGVLSKRNKKQYYVLSEFIDNSIPLQKALIDRCQKKPVRFNKMQWRKIFLQLFNSLAAMKQNFFNHCDLHGDNVFLQSTRIKKNIPLFFENKNRALSLDEQSPIIKFIDFDLGRHSRILTNIMGKSKAVQICPGWISSHAGTSDNLIKSNNLRKLCGLPYDKIAIKGHPIGPLLKVSFQPVDGQWHHFLTFLRAYFSQEKTSHQKFLDDVEKIIKNFSPEAMLAALKEGEKNKECKKTGLKPIKSYDIRKIDFKPACFNPLKKQLHTSIQYIHALLEQLFK